MDCMHRGLSRGKKQSQSCDFRFCFGTLLVEIKILILTACIDTPHINKKGTALVVQHYEYAPEQERGENWHDQLKEHETNLNGEQLANLNGRYSMDHNNTIGIMQPPNHLPIFPSSRLPFFLFSLDILSHSFPVPIDLAIIAEMESGGICTAPEIHKWDWTLHGAIFFMYTLITTVGYGFFAPKVKQAESKCHLQPKPCSAQSPSRLLLSHPLYKHNVHTDFNLCIYTNVGTLYPIAHWYTVPHRPLVRRPARVLSPSSSRFSAWVGSARP